MIGELSLAALAAKIAAAVVIVILSSRATEKAGPKVGSLIATLPVSTGPVYVFLAMDHDAAFIADCARMSVASSLAMLAYVWGHAYGQRYFATAGSIACALGAWVLAALVLQLRDWSIAEALAIYVITFGGSIHLLRGFTKAKGPATAPARARYDLLLRAGLVSCVILATTIAGRTFGPKLTGVIATFPTVFTSLILILQPRWGGAFTAAMMVNGLKGLVGFGLALAVLHFAARVLENSAAALVLALAVAVGWNLGLAWLGRRAFRQAVQGPHSGSRD